MAISYEEALATLQAMFTEPWTRESLDVVLRHEKGHMENTCDLILEHGDKDPQILVARLKAGGPAPQEAMDEQLARRLEDPPSQPSSNASGSRGTPTTLPVDFLRLPGYRPSPSEITRSAPAATSADGQPMDDETLARMLQDELFSEELARNPDFAHLAGRRRSQQNEPRVSASNARIPAAQAGAPLQNPFEGVNVMQKLSSMYSLFGSNQNRISVWFDETFCVGYVLFEFGIECSAIVLCNSLSFLTHGWWQWNIFGSTITSTTTK